MTQLRPHSLFMKRVRREPVVHFALAALLLFAVAELAESRRPDVVQIDRDEMEWRLEQLERSRGVAFDTQERARAESAYIDEQILALEARARGLDDDQRIRSILSQRMLHVLSGGLMQPSEAELRAYLKKNEARYARPPSVDADVVVSSTLSTGGRAPAEGDVSERSSLTGVTRNDLALAFGEDVASSVFRAGPGDWVGPYATESGARWFLVRETIAAGPVPPFEAILGQLRYDWISEREEAFLREQVRELRQGYSVTFVQGRGER